VKSQYVAKFEAFNPFGIQGKVTEKKDAVGFFKWINDNFIERYDIHDGYKFNGVDVLGKYRKVAGNPLEPPYVDEDELYLMYLKATHKKNTSLPACKDEPVVRENKNAPKLVLLSRARPVEHEIHLGSVSQSNNLLLTTKDKAFAERLVKGFNEVPTLNLLRNFIRENHLSAKWEKYLKTNQDGTNQG
jgi:hypothetical protein